MVLPPRPLRLRADFVRRSWTRVLFALAPVLALLLVVSLWQGRAAYDLCADLSVSGEALPVRLLDADVDVIAGIVRHVRIRAEFGRGVERGGSALDHHYAVHDDYYTLFHDAVGDAPLTMRRDEATGRVALSWAMADAPGRAAWLLACGLALLGGAWLLGRAARRALKTLETARAAARASEELELEVVSIAPHHAHGAIVALEIAYRVPPSPGEGPVGYRVPAASAARVRTERFDLADGRPLLLDDETRLLALRPDRRGTEVTVLREGFWPLALDAETLRASQASWTERAAREAGTARTFPPDP